MFRETRSMSSIVYDFPLSHECATENSVTLFSFAQHRSNSCSLSLSVFRFRSLFAVYLCVRVNGVPDSADDLYLNSRPMLRAISIFPTTMLLYLSMDADQVRLLFHQA